jgi:2-polyprenyl-6-methoxyphenol hydroxylase-like FAD-dependent oxidoreductase
MRANLFAYRTMDDPWLRELRQAPQQTLFAAMPGLRKLMGDFQVIDRIQIRPVDLHVSKGHIQPGVVLLGDAFATSCPAAGTGARKALNDAERLCNVHIPQWLATPGMGTDKVAAFYQDPVKHACDEASLAKAYELRSFSVDPAFAWAARRLVKFGGQLARGSLRRVQGRLAAGLPHRQAAGSEPQAARSYR